MFADFSRKVGNRCNMMSGLGNKLKDRFPRLAGVESDVLCLVSEKGEWRLDELTLPDEWRRRWDSLGPFMVSSFSNS